MVHTSFYILYFNCLKLNNIYKVNITKYDRNLFTFDILEHKGMRVVSDSD